MKYRPFEDAREFVRSLKLESADKWRKYSTTERPSNIPSHPDRQYKNIGWLNWNDWLGKSNDQRRYKVNDNYFKIFSSNMAYILGFWFADGYMKEKVGIFSITQHKKDQYLLERILANMDSNHLIKYHYHNNITFIITSHEIV